MKQAKTLLFILSFLPIYTFSQSISAVEDSVNWYRNASISAQKDSSKLIYNDHIVRLLKELLDRDDIEIEEHEFKSLEKFSVQRAKDITLISWDLKLNAFNSQYFGVIGYPVKKQRKSKVLQDKGLEDGRDQGQIYDETNWPGAIYYEMVPFKRKNGWSFLLLGFRGENTLEHYKVAEILSVSKSGVSFGLPVLIDGSGKSINRWIEHYQSNLSFSVKYDEKQKLFYYNRLQMIDDSKGEVYNNLTPTYTFDGYKYQGGKWVKQERVTILKPE